MIDSKTTMKVQTCKRSECKYIPHWRLYQITRLGLVLFLCFSNNNIIASTAAGSSSGSVLLTSFLRQQKNDNVSSYTIVPATIAAFATPSRRERLNSKPSNRQRLAFVSTLSSSLLNTRSEHRFSNNIHRSLLNDNTESDNHDEPETSYHPQQQTSPSQTTDQINKNSKDDVLKEALASLTHSKSSLLGTKSLGVDYGLVRTGIAVTVGYDPKPMTILSDYRNDTSLLCNQIIKLVQAEEVDQIVLGLPFHKNGTVAEQTLLTREFANRLALAVYAYFGPGERPIYLWDERYTSKEAAARALAVDPKANLFKGLDADAACIILEHFYADNGEGAEQVLLPEVGTEVRDALEEAWLMRKGEKERERMEYREQRERRLNARQMAMERAKILDKKLLAENGGKRKGKKKKKKKKNNLIGNGNKNSNGRKADKWIVL